MKGFAHRARLTPEDRRALRLHNLKFRQSETDRRRISNALETLSDLNQSIERALADLAANHVMVHPNAVGYVRLALSLLANGPEGEFK